MKTSTKILSCTTAAALLCAALPFAVFAENENGKVRIVVENNTFTKADGAKWEGTLIDEWVELKADSTAADLLINTLAAHGYTQTGAENGYITDINGLSASADAAGMGGWMTGYDDWYGNNGITSIVLTDGDELELSYSLNWGADIGYDWSGTDTSLKSLTADKGIISEEFVPTSTEYTFTLPEGSTDVQIIPVAENKNYRYKIYKNEYTPDSNNDYKRSSEIPVANGDTIYIGVGHASWHSYLPDGVTETVYKLNISIPGAESTEPSEEISDTPTEPSENEPSDIEKEDVSVDRIIEEVTANIKSNSLVASAGNEWEIFALARLNSLDEDIRDTYVENLKEYLADANFNKATDYAKFTIVITSIGFDAADFEGVNYVAGLSDYDFAVKQGINGAVYTLLALDTKGYEIPDAPEGAEQNTREKLIDFILSSQLTDGGWTFYGDVYEPDMTGIALQALAPYYDSDDNVKAAVDKALELLSAQQNDDGTYTSYGAPNSENSAQVVTALSALGIDSDKDSRFIKSNGSALDGLKKFYLNGEGAFTHTLDGEANTLSTDQAYYSLVAYKRFVNGETRLYDMTDIEGDESEIVEPIEDESSDNEESIPEESDNTENSDNSKAKPSETVEPSTPVNDNNALTSSQNDNAGTVATGDNGAGCFVIVMFISAAAILVLKRNKAKEN